MRSDCMSKWCVCENLGSFFFFKQKTAYEMRISDWSSDVCSSDLIDWAELFESVSLVDERLRAASAFAAMDFPTRDLYRNAIEQLEIGRASCRERVCQYV